MLLHLIPIIVIGTISLAIIIERAYALYWKFPINNYRFLAEIKQKVLSNDVGTAIQICANQNNTLCASVVKGGLLRASRDNKQIQATLEILAHEAIATARKRIAYLAMFANVATLFGLLGTIAGLIKAFAAVANVDAATKSILLAEGISTSMNATAAGLLVAIPSMIAFSILQSKANRIIEDIENAAMVTMDLLSTRLYRDEWDDMGNPKNKAIPPVITMSDKNKAA